METRWVRLCQLTRSEVFAGVRKLRKCKAAGEDAVPPEYIGALLVNEAALAELTNLLNHCWRSKRVPERWKQGHVVPLYKKGDQGDP